MVDSVKTVVVEEVSKQIIENATPIPCSEGILGGVAVTGFIDVEKIIKICGYKTKFFFLEKKLPFSYVLLNLDPLREREQQ
ncbi:hypothetical protein [Thermovenabulum gondwanense]|uniref:Uncharacterized protein n=1 Tax=Thermovenabulum gondwanense TaxID=520767 RepID=A0A162MLP4_9FIRM|nr:hypothetical protein [Thermovenabulum gondwanense]KYO66664.1 hypothetical protein ATZ99_09070 [Thermovenabulum gondwanense]